MTAMSASGGKSQGQIDYEADVARKPRYSDRTPRKTWDELPEYARWSWEHEPANPEQSIAA